MSKTQRQQPTTPKQNLRQLKRERQWQVLQPPPKVYPEPEAPRWNPLG